MTLNLLLILLAATVVVLVLVMVKQKRYFREQRRLTTAKIRELESERDILIAERNDLEVANKKARFEHLQLSKDHQDRSALLQSLYRKITKYKEEGRGLTSELNKLLSMIEKDANQEKDALIIHLEQVNTSYVDRLKAQYPNLTIYDYRLCTLIKTGMSTREIANLLNVLPSSVNVSRSRLRKKLGLTPKQDLYTVLNAVE